jgi:hypothetical protein
MIEYLSMLTCTDKYTAIFSVGQIITNAAISDHRQAELGYGVGPSKRGYALLVVADLVI